ncbi:MAG: HEAT repeat domain-containing protein [Planctomycetota bacterium]|jgi:succinate dehydrogenase flavin-adding protein (antitoxin of CptAB toxin-antitoxin module)
MKVAVRLCIVIVGLSAVMAMEVRKGPSRRDEAQKELDWKTLIVSDNPKDRTLADQLVEDTRKGTIEHLLCVVNSPVEPPEPFYNSMTSRSIAISLLGRLRAKEAVPALMRCLFPRPGQGVKVSEPPVFSPAGFALIEIGLPSVAPLIESLKSDKLPAYRRARIKIIVRIKGLRETELLLEELIAHETNGAKKDNLKVAQALLEDAKFLKILENLDKQRTWL